MNAHTPGPWIKRDWMVYAPNGIKNPCPDGQAIANCAVTSTEVTREELDANTHLIAAAPEMLEILKQVDRVYGDRYPDVVSVIAKAEGRTP